MPLLMLLTQPTYKSYTLIPGLIELLREVYSKSGHYTSSSQPATASQPQVELDCRMRGSLSDG